MTEIQKVELAKVSRKIESLLDDNKKGKIIIFISESGKITAEAVEAI